MQGFLKKFSFGLFAACLNLAKVLKYTILRYFLKLNPPAFASVGQHLGKMLDRVKSRNNVFMFGIFLAHQGALHQVFGHSGK